MQLAKSISSVFKLIYSQLKDFYKNAKLLSNCNTLCVLQNCDTITNTLNKINKKMLNISLPMTLAHTTTFLRCFCK